MTFRVFFFYMLWLNSLSFPLLPLFPYPPLKLFLPTSCMSSFNHLVQSVLQVCVVGIKPLAVSWAITQLHPRRKLTLLPWQPAAANSSSAKSGVLWAPPQSMLEFLLAWSIVGFERVTTVTVMCAMDYHAQKAMFCNSPQQPLALLISQLHLSQWSQWGEDACCRCPIYTP